MNPTQNKEFEPMNKRVLDIAHRQNLAYAELMAPARTRPLQPAKWRSVYMSFVRYADGWHCRFLEADKKTQIIERLVFRDKRKIIEAARRGNPLMSVRSMEAMDRAIAVGSGGISLYLTQDQYSKLISKALEHRPSKPVL
jgi:hypothetical protein